MVSELTGNFGSRQLVATNTSIPRNVATNTSIPRNNETASLQQSNSTSTALNAGDKGVPVSQQPGANVSSEDVMEAVHKMQDYMQVIDRDLHFSIDEESGITIVKVIDPETKEVVRQIPSEEVMRVVRSLENGGGLLSDVTA